VINHTVTSERKSSPGVRGILTLFAVILLTIGAAAFFALLPRLSRQQTLLAEARADGVHIPIVVVTRASRAPSAGALELPGSLQALNEAPIYARAEGYMKERLVDIGYAVKQGQLMATLETPELDQQIRQAEAALSQAKAAIKQNEANVQHAVANLQLSRVTFERWKQLTSEGVLSKQAEDEKQADFDLKKAELESAQANLAAANNAVSVNEANLRRLQELKAFSRIVAPFDGMVTSRNADAGTLISAGNGGANREIFRVAQLDPLRIFVDVPQIYVESVRAASGKPARVTVQQFPGREFAARIVRTNAALDPSSRTMLTVLYVDNPRKELLPGMYATVKFTLNETYRPLVIPGDTVVSRPNGPNVAVVGGDGRVHMRRIQPGRDFGSRVEVLGGIREGDALVVNPTDEIQDNVRVQVRSAS
jgi:RND family efflux transporter MFP subunit